MPRVRKTGARRRATILLMVVSLLALLFVIVTGYLSLSLYERQTFQRVQRGNVIDRAMDSIEQLVLSKIADSLDGKNGTLGRDPRHMVESIPGAPSHNWLAFSEPVRDMAVTNAKYIAPADPNYYSLLGPNPLNAALPHWLDQYRYVSTTWLDGVSEFPRFVRQLMLEDPTDMDAFFEDSFADNDIIRNTLLCFMDADGDGVPDTYFPGVTRAIDLAGAVAGTPVRTPRIERDLLNPLNSSPFQTSAIPAAGATGGLNELWRAYQELRRFDVAIRVIAHGGMLALDSPTNANWNRQFVAGMFNHLRRDGAPMGIGGVWDDRFDQIKSASSVIESTIRRRGGVLPAYYDPDNVNQQGDRRLPPVLRFLERAYPATFDFSVPVGGETPSFPSWQRFNLDDNNVGLARYFRAVWADPATYNTSAGATNPNSVLHYDRRHSLTTVSYSDDIARKQGPDFDPAGALLTTRRGDRKFYLGDLDAAFNPQTGEFLGGPGQTGRRVAIELKKYFTDMLAGHDFSGNDPTGNPQQPTTDPNVQAWMLAVNTLQFAAPRRTDGQIDVVYYDDSGADAALFPGVFPAGYVPTARVYTGYAPQPFITQLVAYNSEDDPNEPDEEIALLVELYNPSDPDPVNNGNPNDRFALRLDQFGLTIGDADPMIPGNVRVLESNATQTIVQPLGAAINRMPGRRFISVAMHEGVNNFFETAITPANGQPIGTIIDATLNIDRNPGNNNHITVKLWRRGVINGAFEAIQWHLVDQQTVDVGPEPGQTEQWWAQAYRDTSADAYFGADASVDPPRLGRWRMGVAFDPNDTGEYKGSMTSSQVGGIGIALLEATINQPGPTGAGAVPLPGSAETPWTPAVPLPIMNAGATADLPVHGVNRPRSFPTVGFMAFVPRFSHTVLAGGLGARKPMTEWLRDQYNGLLNSQKQPDFANLGHMPIIDNTQPAKPQADSYFAQENAGQLPWGLLVFDYFTTHDPSIVDPTRIPGRIDINTAPWYLLAGLPVIGPNPNAGYNAPLAVASPSFQPAAPEFWSSAGGMLFGVGAGDGAYYSSNAYAWPPPGGEGPYRTRFLGVKPTGSGFVARQKASATPNGGMVHWDATPVAGAATGWYRLGPWLAQATTAYRDRIQLFASMDVNSTAWGAYVFANARNDLGTFDPDPAEYRDESPYGEVRRKKGSAAGAEPHRGFVSLGELINVAGFDSTTGDDMKTALISGLAPHTYSATTQGDFIKSVSLMALLDTHFLTVRSNTFTVYVSIMDRENPQASVRSQLTVDRSNLLPSVVQTAVAAPANPNVTVDADGLPDVITSKRIGYFNARYDD